METNKAPWVSHKDGKKFRLGDLGKIFPTGAPKQPQSLWVGGGSKAVSLWATELKGRAEREDAISLGFQR